MIDNQINTLTTLLKPAVEIEGFELLGCEFNASHKHSMLRVYIDHINGVKVSDCETISKQLAAILDVNDPISGRYTLEVTSPGIDRPLFTLKHYQNCIGQLVQVQLFEALEGQRKFKGILSAITNNDEILLEIEGKQVKLPFALIKKANLVYNFEGIKGRAKND